MKLDYEQECKLSDARQRLRRTWLLWGLAPLGLFLLLTLAVSGVEASTADDSEQQMQRRFEAALAVSALLFFVGFSLDGRWTDAERLGKRIHKASGGETFTPTRLQLAASADVAFTSIDGSVTALTAFGIAIGLIAVLAVLSGLPLACGIQLVALAAIYQLFIFSRHPYYNEVLQAAAQGELTGGQDDNGDS